MIKICCDFNWTCMPDSQLYPLNIYLINNLEDIVVFLVVTIFNAHNFIHYQKLMSKEKSKVIMSNFQRKIMNISFIHSCSENLRQPLWSGHVTLKMEFFLKFCLKIVDFTELWFNHFNFNYILEKPGCIISVYYTSLGRWQHFFSFLFGFW